MSTKELQSIDLGKLAQVTGGNIVAPGASQMNTMLQEITTALAGLGGGNTAGAGMLGLGGSTAAPTNNNSSMDQMMSMMMMMMGRGGGGGGGGFPFGGNGGGFPF